MGEKTTIAWCDHTFNPWRGCAKVSTGCEHCYAELQARRNPAVFGTWGPDGVRVPASERAWKQLESWDRRAAINDDTESVFVGSMCDVFEERDDLDPLRVRLCDTIARTDALQYLLLTKRPEHVTPTVRRACDTLCKLFFEDPEHWADPLKLPNVWIGTSVEDQRSADSRGPDSYHLGDMGMKTFLSVEPLVGRISLSMPPVACAGARCVIIGGESGPRARPCHVEWIERIVQQCDAADADVVVKQFGRRPLWNGKPLRLKDKKGGDWDEWPDELEHLRRRELPW